MVGGTRKIVALYEKFKAVGSGSALGRGRGRGRGKGKGKVKGARPPSPVASSSSSKEEEVPSAPLGTRRRYMRSKSRWRRRQLVPRSGCEVPQPSQSGRYLLKDAR